MDLDGKIIVVTGAGNGIGAAMCERFAAESPAGIVVADLDEQAADWVAQRVGGMPFSLDVADEAAVISLIASTEEKYGRIDLLCLNAGIAAVGDLTTSNSSWQRMWEVNVMSHVYGARAALPAMLERESGYLLHTASAAGLLTSIAAAPYSVTKHAVVALAEWLSITYGSAGISVSCLSPQYVTTPMLDFAGQVGPEYAEYVASNSISVAQLAESVVEGIRAERFHILPHSEVAEYFAARAIDPERWLSGMRRLQDELAATPPRNVGPSDPQ